MRSIQIKQSLLIAGLFLTVGHSVAGSYTEIYEAPPTGTAIRSFLPYKMYIDHTDKHLLTSLYVDAVEQKEPPPPAYTDSLYAEKSPNIGTDTEKADVSFSVPFAFNSSKLSRTAEKIVKRAAQSVTGSNYGIVIGRADTIGTSDYNLNLSERRAKNIAKALQREGVNKDKIQIRAVGEASAVENCSNIRKRIKRISCEAPNRSARIDIYRNAD